MTTYVRFRSPRKMARVAARHKRMMRSSPRTWADLEASDKRQSPLVVKGAPGPHVPRKPADRMRVRMLKERFRDKATGFNSDQPRDDIGRWT